jgi:hypothetical protein
MAEYRAKDGQPDRHGEMTGAITVNMAFTMIPIVAWSFFIGPWLLEDHVWWITGIAVAMAVVLPFVWLRPSRALWAWFGELLERER